MSSENASPPQHQESAAPPTGGGGGGGGGGGIALNTGYLKSIPAILKIVQFFVLMVAFACIADIDIFGGTWGRRTFFLFVTIVCWLLVIAVFVVFLLSLNDNISVDWNLVILLNSIVWAVLLLISSALLADDAATLHFFSGSRFHNNLVAGAVFGFLSMILVALDGAYHLIFGMLQK